ncbi:MAG TPA: prolyl oligopeptidase family serine peptidase [Pyrinomonadaceae bacterium]|jgi:dienelactone hydrolase|nr:prolyl oligopeptidase family serine peptidase [Pyrinomonadaceae bacterium]
MKTILLTFVLILCTCAFAAAQGVNASNTDGKIIEQAVYALPAYEEISARFGAYPRQEVEKMRTSPELELLKITYMSDGLKIKGFIYKPKATTGKKLPTIIFNRGGLADGIIGPANFNYLWEMHRYASEGFVVLASQYRGADGGEGRDEAGGADTNDVMNLIQVARSLDYVDMSRLFMWGFSRGAVMTLQAVKRGAPLRAAVIVGGPTDYLALANDQGFLEFARNAFPDFEKRKDEHLRSRSAVLWADQLNVPLLILQGAADPGLRPTQAMALAQKMDEAGKLYELIIYAKDDHPISINAEDRLRRTIDWFKNTRRISIAQPLTRTLAEQGTAAAIKQYHELKKSGSELYDFGEAELNRLGYTLLAQGRAKDAIEIFKLNVAIFPQAFNTYDSLGEAYLADGQRELAIQNYRKSLELNPQNTNATDVLKRINAQK